MNCGPEEQTAAFSVGALIDYKMLDGGWGIWLPRRWMAGLRPEPPWTEGRMRLSLFIGCLVNSPEAVNFVCHGSVAAIRCGQI